MQIEEERPSVFQVTLHAYELTSLVAAARWVANGAEGELPDEAREQIEDVLDRYDAERERMEAVE